MLGRYRAATTGTPFMTTLPQGTWTPWTATIGTTVTPGSSEKQTVGIWLASFTTNHGSRAWSEMTRWQPGPEGFYDDYGLGLGRYRFPAGQAIGHHGVWGAFAFWSPEHDAVITGTINTGRVDRRPLLEAVARDLLPPAAAPHNRP